MPWFKQEHPVTQNKQKKTKMNYVNVENLDFSLMVNLKSILIYTK